MLASMSKRLREGAGALLLMCALVVLAFAITHLRDQEYVGAVLMVTTGLSLLRAGVELMRPSMGE
jgi:hypothetical protein